VLILDEATSNLDAESEAAVQAALARLMQGRTTIIVAHRLSTVRDADRIVVLDGARVVEQGRHDELMARRGTYHRLVEHQLIADPRPAVARARPELRS
jgi:ABC-type multidrug transport system fused ATPase/permease subunit